MKLYMFKSLALLFCVGAINQTLSARTSYKQSPTKFISFKEIEDIEKIDKLFSSKKSSRCQKAAAALYKTQQYIKDRDMEKACSSSKEAKYLNEDFVCNEPGIGLEYLEPAWAQRDYMCTKDSHDDYCDVTGAYYANEITEKNLKLFVCSANTDKVCRDKYMTMINRLSVIEDGSETSTTITVKDANQEEDILEITSRGIMFEERDIVNEVCYIDTEKISNNGRCGSGNGKCSNGKCCSKYGYCGTSSKHCDIDAGCQTGFGKCNSDDNTTTTKAKTITSTKTTKKPSTTKSSKSTIKISEDGRCGTKELGRCRDGYCCSKNGWCGNSDLHCEKSNGCLSEYGKCN